MSINTILLITILNLNFCIIAFPGFSVMKKSY